MEITHDSIRAAGGIVHSDGNIFFRDISMLQVLVGAVPASVTPLPAVLEQIALGWDGCKYDAPGETLDIGADIRAAAARLLAEQPAAATCHAEALAKLRHLYLNMSSGSVRDKSSAKRIAEGLLAPAIAALEAAPALEAPAAPAGDLFDCEVRPHPLRYPLAAYHHAPGNGPLHATWQDKPHRIVYDLVAAVRHYAALAAAPQAPAAPVGDEREAFEAWIKKDGGDLSTFGSGQNRHYNNSAVNNAWTGWCSRAALAAPAAPAVDARDTARMDWLEAQVVNVRAPLRYGSRDMFWASPEEVDGGPDGPSDLRARIDAAQAAAKGENGNG